MANYPYTLKSGSLKRFIERIPMVGIPDSVNQKYLTTLDFKSTNDRPIISILKFIGFLDNSGKPTETYKSYRDKSKSEFVLGNAIRSAYLDLFKIYPDAHIQSNQNLHNFFSTQTGLGEKAIKSIVETFKTLCSLAKFDGNKDSDTIEESNTKQNTENPSSNQMHSISLGLEKGRIAKIIVPQDITENEVDKLKKLLDAFK